MRLGGVKGDPQRLGHLAGRQPLAVVEQQDRAVAVGQLLQHGVEGLGLGASRRHDGGVDRIVGVLPSAQQVERLGVDGLGAAAAALGQAAVESDAVEPGADRRVASEAAEAPVGVDHRLLDHVLGTVGPDDLARQRQQPRTVTAHQLPEGGSLTTTGGHHEVNVAPLRSHSRIRCGGGSEWMQSAATRPPAPLAGREGGI